MTTCCQTRVYIHLLKLCSPLWYTVSGWYSGLGFVWILFSCRRVRHRSAAAATSSGFSHLDGSDRWLPVTGRAPGSWPHQTRAVRGQRSSTNTNGNVHDACLVVTCWSVCLLIFQRLERQTRNMDQAQYAEFCESRQLSFGKFILEHSYFMN